MTIGVLPANPSTDHTDPYDHRQQLSALMDGELDADQARFLLRRIGHDDALAACQERWQLIGDVLRGQASVLAPSDFTAHVQQALDAEIAIHQTKHTRWKPWGARVALAASIAAVSVLFLSRTSFLAKPASVETALSADVSSHTQTPARAISAEVVVPITPVDPFALAPEPAAKPWPRSNLSAASDTFNARALSQNEPFYPFTPQPPPPEAASSH